MGGQRRADRRAKLGRGHIQAERWASRSQMCLSRAKQIALILCQIKHETHVHHIMSVEETGVENNVDK